MLKERLLKVFSISYLINIIIFLPLIELLNDKLRYKRRITHLLYINIIYIKTYNYFNSIIINGFITRITKRCLKRYKVNTFYFNFL
jgi:hypothetical protein